MPWDLRSVFIWLFEFERGRCTSRLLWVIYAGVPAAWPGGAVVGGA